MEQKEPAVPLMAYALSAVRKTTGGVEPYALPKEGRQVLKAAIRALLLSPASAVDQRAALKQVMALAHTMKTKHASPATGRALIEVLTSFPEAAKILGLESIGLRQQQRSMRRFLGSQSVKRAPVLAHAAPVGSIRLSSMLAARTREYR